MNVKKHIDSYIWIKDNGLTWELPKTISSNTIINVKDKLTDNIELLIWIKTSTKSLQIQLIGNIDFLRYASSILHDIESYKIDRLLQQIELKTLLSFQPNDVISTLNDSTIPQKYWGVYLTYFLKENLNEEEKSNLWKSLSNYYDKIDNSLFFKNHKSLFYTRILASSLFMQVSNLTYYVKKLKENEKYFKLLQWLSLHISESLDEDNLDQILSDADNILKCFKKLKDLIHGQERSFLFQWLQNHSLLYDLNVICSKVNNSTPFDFYEISKDRTSYITFIYSNEPLLSKAIHQKEKEHLIIYAIVHKKRAFLSLIRENLELFNSIPSNSILFNSTFYTKLVNLNSLNKQNLVESKKLKYFSEKWMTFLTEPPYTFNEIAIFSKNSISSVYVKLYAALNLSLDKKLIVIRELIKKNCLLPTTKTDELSKCLSIKPLSAWMQKEFAHIGNIDASLSINLLEQYSHISHLISEITSVAEVRYIIENDTLNISTVKELLEGIFSSQTWLQLQEEFEISTHFIEKYKSYIKEFLLKDGPHIILTYLKKNYHQKESLRRIVIAELMGRFRELKYYKNDLKLELEFPISDEEIDIWSLNSKLKKGKLEVWEEDALIPIMQMGVLPYRTCLSYIDGTHSNALLACHDSNKKVLYLTYNNKIVLRAAIRLTKGFFGTGTYKQTLEFVDLEHPNVSKKKKEYLTLFLERSYVANLPSQELENAYSLILALLAQKASKLNAQLIISNSYDLRKQTNIVKIPYSLFISKSKSTEQYLDSLGGSCNYSKSGDYYSNNYYILKN